MASIRKNKGRWQAVIRKKFHPTVTKSFLSKAEASRWARNSELKIERGVFETLDEANRTKLKELLERYVLEVTPKKKGAIQEAFKIRRLMRLKIADYSLAIITPTKIAKFRIEFEYIISKFLTYFSLATFEIGLFYSLTIILFKVIFVNKKLQK